MRLYQLTEDRSDFPNTPTQNQKYYDDESGLFLNPPTQWSKSPYLGAVKAKGGGYIAQVHIPQNIWAEVIQDSPKWRDKLPDGFYSPSGNNRSPIRIVRTSDPRQAAWVAQAALYGHEDFAERLDDFLTLRYVENKPGKAAFNDIIKNVPSFDGEPLTVADADEWMQNAAARTSAERKETNSSKYNQEMPKRIVAAFNEKMRSGKARRKVFGNRNMTLSDVSNAVLAAIKKFGVDHFVTTPGSIKIKDPETFNLTAFA